VSRTHSYVVVRHQGILNGWPSLRCLELISLEGRRDRSTGLPSAKELLTGQILWRKAWDVRDEGARGIGPRLPAEHQVCRAKLRGAPWTALGWSKDSPGFVFWFEAQHSDGPRLLYGTKMIESLSDAKCSMIHMVSHRYAVPRESPKDRITYHSVCFLEWEHGLYGTVVESAYLNGMVSALKLKAMYQFLVCSRLANAFADDHAGGIQRKVELVR